MRAMSVATRLPLLAKELVEQASRGRTYLMRSAYALALFSIFLIYVFVTVTDRGALDIVELKGQGGAIFSVIVVTQVVGVLILLPAMMAGAIAQERERNCLDLLIITDLSLWDIILQKWLSRLIPMGTLLLMGLPLLAVAYAYGGLESDQVWSTIYILALTLLQVGAISLFLSMDAPKTAESLMSCYVRLPLALLGLMLIGLLVGMFGLVPIMILESIGVGLGHGYFASGSVVPMVLLLMPPPFLGTIIFTAPTILVIYIYLKRARTRMEKIIFANPAKPPEQAFVLAKSAKVRLQRSDFSLPATRPVAWRELSSHLMQQLRSVFLVIVLLTLPCLMFVMAHVPGEDGSQVSGLAFLISSTWVVGGAVLCLVAANAFSSERTHQTLDVLLSLPISTREVILQKTAVARRLVGMLLVPFAMVIALEAILEHGNRWSPRESATAATARYVVCAIGSLGVFIPILLWGGILIGLKGRDRTRTTLYVLGILGFSFWGVPFLIEMLIDVLGVGGSELAAWLRVLSPDYVITMNEASALWSPQDRIGGWLAVSVNFSLYATVAWLLRRSCFRYADQWLGRIPDNDQFLLAGGEGAR
jgi:ABC-type transport system involved in multi-copper enzyme maturation permease subunit